MLIVKLLFAVLIIVCIVFYIMYLWDFALVLLAVVIAVPVIMFIITVIKKNLISVEFVLKNDCAAKNESFPIQLRVTNRSIFPVGKAEARIEYSNMCSKETNFFSLFMPIQARNSQSISFQLKSKYCGIVNVRCAGITIYDPLKIFKFRLGRNINTVIAILPEGHEISGEVCCTDRINEESSIFSEFKPGDDPSEVFDLRGYAPGDKLNRIHWKLSSKKDEFIVKEYSLPVDIPCTIFLNLRCKSVRGELLLPVFDTLIETFISMSQFLLENERVHSFVYYSGAQKRFVEVTIDSIDTLAAVTRELILSIRDISAYEEPDALLTELGEVPLSSFIFITAEPDPAVAEFIEENIDADIKNAVVIVSGAEDAADMISHSSDINTIPVVIGRITSSIKDIEI